MVKRLNQALQIANAIAIAVFVTAYKDFHESTVVPALRQMEWLACKLRARNEGDEQQGHTHNLRP